MTNRDKLISNLSNTDLAEILLIYCTESDNCKFCLIKGICCDNGCDMFRGNMISVEKWLEQEVEE